MKNKWEWRVEDVERELEVVLTQLDIKPFCIGWISVGVELDIRSFKLWDRFSEIKLQEISWRTSMPIQNAYETPHTLGTDRIVAVIGARSELKDKPVLVIDAGTAITYDYADREGKYLGGGIGPGLRMRFQALNEFTARLPLVEISENAPLVGNSTVSSIRSGVMNGMLAEISGTIEAYRELAGPDLQVFLTGGDASYFEKRLKNINFASLNLIHIGIDHILNYLFHESNHPLAE